MNDIVGVKFPNRELKMAIHGRGELLSDIIRRRGKYSERDLEIYDLILRTGDLFVDVGANIGWYSLYASMVVGNAGKVVAIEPEPKNFQLLTKNIELNGFKNIEALEIAVGKQKEERNLFISEQNLGDNFILPEGLDDGKTKNLKVKVETLDSIVSKEKIKPRLIKIDVQGFEPEVLAGMKETMSGKDTPFILVEFSPGLISRAGGSPFEIFAFIEKNKLIPFRVAGDGDTSPIAEEVSIQALLNFTRDYRNTDIGWDILLASREKIKELSFSEEAFNKSAYLSERGNFEEAEKVIEGLPNAVRGIASQKGRLLLRKGKFKEAHNLFQEDEKFYSVEKLFPNLPKEKKYQAGIDLKNKKLFIIQQGGMGDCVAFSRFIETYQNLGAKIIMGANKLLWPILSRSFGPNIEMREPGTVKQNEYDYYISDSIANSVILLDRENPISDIKMPYIFSNPEYVEKWRKEIEQYEDGRSKIGLHWRGMRDKKDIPHTREVSYELLKKFSDIGTTFSFQNGMGTEDIVENDKVINIGEHFKSLEDTLGMLELVDVVVTGDALLANLAGAMGKKTALLACIDPFFLWISKDDKTEWYPSVKIFRQTVFGDWNKPVADAYEWVKSNT